MNDKVKRLSKVMVLVSIQSLDSSRCVVSQKKAEKLRKPVGILYVHIQVQRAELTIPREMSHAHFPSPYPKGIIYSLY